MTAKILSFVLSIIFVCGACGFLAGCDSKKVDPKNCFHKMASVENLLTQDKFRSGDCVQVQGFAAPYPVEGFYYFSKTRERKKGSWIIVSSEQKLPISKRICVKGRWDITDGGSVLVAHGYFLPL
jgi:hypothetical protein